MRGYRGALGLPFFLPIWGHFTLAPNGTRGQSVSAPCDLPASRFTQSLVTPQGLLRHRNDSGS